MKRTIKHIAPWLAAAAIGGALVCAPVASADSSADPGPSPSQSQSGGDPLVPFGTHPDTELPYNDGGWDPQPAGAV